MLLACLFSSIAAVADTPRLTTVILVRHAEKADTTPDTSLSAAGIERAKELARSLAGTPIAAIYTTQFARTRETAAPIAAALKITPVVVEAGGAKSYAAEMAARIRSDHSGQTVLVVGHSNTTRDVIKQLGVVDPPAIADSQFDDLFIVTITEGAAPSLVSLRYGAVAR
jgi:broad specificity phosphatase PhoE